MTINDLKGNYNVVGVHPTAPTPPPTSSGGDLLSKAAGVATSIFPGTGAIGEGLGTALANIGQVARGKSPNIPVNVPKMAGGILQAGALPVSLGAAAPASVLGAAAQYGGLGAISSAGASLEHGNSASQVATDAAKGGAIGGATGGIFNLLGKGISAIANKTAPSALSFTSGVPKAAIEQAAANPATAKEGLGLTVNEVRNKALGSLDSLHTDLGTEFQTGLKQLGATQADTTGLAPKLFTDARNIAEKYKVSLEGAAPAFQKSAIVSPGEQKAVTEAFNTLKTWDDFSAHGMQDLSARIGALKNWDEAGTTRSSAIIGKIYTSIGDAIKTHYPDLSTLRTNYATNRDVLNQIGNVLSAGKDQPTQIQAAVSRLDNIFKENRDEYVNVIRHLGQRSGVDYLSMLAGGEFQKVLPGIVRGLGGGGALSVGASVLNPYLLLLTPLFSPRAVGAIVRNAPAAAKATSQLTRAATTQAIRQTAQPAASGRAK